MSETNCGRVAPASRGTSPPNPDDRAAAALSQLTTEQRLVCVWKKAGFSDAEIATHLGWPCTKVEEALNRAAAAVHRLLNVECAG